MRKVKGTMTYGEWMGEVNKLIVSTVGMGVDDLEDWDSRVHYAEGASPAEGALECLREQSLIDDVALFNYGAMLGVEP
jgi:hypothetical protein